MGEHEFPVQLLHSYAKHGCKSVHGWLHPDSALILSKLSEAQDELNVTGGVGEIGVHHGKLFILLHLMLRKGERSFVVDIFENQHLNLDQSGRGDREVFLRNVKRLGGKPELIDIFHKSSLEVTAEEIVEKTGKIRIFSIDGGHTAEITLNDLIVAEQAIAEGGIIIIDDYFNQEFPGVSEGVAKFFIERKPKIKPIAILPNKVLLTDEKLAEAYKEILKKKASNWYLKTSDFFGKDVLIFTPPKTLEEAIARSKIYQNNKEGKFLKETLRPLVRKVTGRQ